MPSSDSLISAIVPCYNSAATIKETLGSLEAQTHGNWEAIIIDDGSTDGSSEVIKRLESADPRVRSRWQPNQGLGSARNTGIQTAQGDYFVFLDSDDILLPHMMERLLRAIQRNPPADIAHCGLIYSDSGLVARNWRMPAETPSDYFFSLAHSNLFACHCILLRRPLFQRMGMFDPAMRSCHDWDLWLRAARAGARFTAVSEPLAVYRLSPISMSRNPLVHFEAGRHVISLGHAQDARVANPDPRYVHGCNCDKRSALRALAVVCAGFAIAQNQHAVAQALLDENSGPDGPALAASEMDRLLHALCFAHAVPRTDLSGSWQRVGCRLLEFLAIHEARTGRPGLAIHLPSTALSRHPLVPEARSRAGSAAVYAYSLARSGLRWVRAFYK